MRYQSISFFKFLYIYLVLAAAAFLLGLAAPFADCHQTGAAF